MIFTTKLGSTRAGPRTRLWLEGNRLLQHGFQHGDKFRKTWSAGRLVIQTIPNKDFERDSCGTVSGSTNRPIIDITGARFSETFQGQQVSVRFADGRITVTDQP